MMMQTGSKAALEKLCQGLRTIFIRKLPLGTNHVTTKGKCIQWISIKSFRINEEKDE